MIEICVIDNARRADIHLPNEPFRLFGRMIPSYIDGQWGYRTVLFDEEDVSELCFPDEDYDYDAMKEDCVFLGAYEDGACIALAVLRDAMFRYMYLYDLKVCRASRSRGVGRMLLDRAMETALARGYNGLYTQGQDNNLAACLFYLKTGFHIGGLDTNVYRGTSQEGKADILFYWDGVPMDEKGVV